MRVLMRPRGQTTVPTLRNRSSDRLPVHAASRKKANSSFTGSSRLSSPPRRMNYIAERDACLNFSRIVAELVEGGSRVNAHLPSDTIHKGYVCRSRSARCKAAATPRQI